MADRAMPIAVLDGVADGHELSPEEREQVRVFRERLRALAERHNARVSKKGGR